MTMFHAGDERGPIPSYFLAEIIDVDAAAHTCSVQLLRGFEQYSNVILMRDIGNFSLPKVGDLCSVFWDNKNKPVVNGYYPVFYENKKDLNQYYFVQPGERMIQSDFGQKLLMNKQGDMFLTNWSSQGIEIEEKTGIVTIRTDTNIIDTAGLSKRHGYAKRIDEVNKKYSTIFSTTISEVTTASSVGGSDTVVEDATIINAVDSAGKDGAVLYESKVGSKILAEGSTSSTGFIDVVAHSKTGKPLRSLTKYYVDGSTTNAVTIEVDINGNTNISIPSTATDSGVNIEGIASDIALHFQKLDLDATEVNLGTLASEVKALVWADVLTILSTHTHPYLDDGNPSTTSPSVQLVDIGSGTYQTIVTKAN